MALAVSQRLSAHTSSRAAGPLRRARAARRSVAVCAAADRPVWFPGNPPPSYLDGSLAGDYGFDPLRLGSDPEVLKWFVQAELQNGRWAMLGTAGILFPAIATKVGAADIPPWFEAGKVAVEGQSTGSFATLLVVEFILFHWVETVRYYDFKKPGALSNGQFFGITDGFKGVENGYPGGVFDPFGFSKGPQYKEYKDKEIKNARLAMVSFVGYLVQYAATGKGPIDNLADHLADPFHTTFTSNGVSLPFVSWGGF